MRKKYIVGTVLCIVFGILLWTTDAITLQGEWTIYTAECLHGAWAGNVCMGQIVASDRYRFHASQGDKEVLFWINGASNPSGRLKQCSIIDGRNWTCQTNAEGVKSITLQLRQDIPGHSTAANTRPFHDVSKFKWVLLKCMNFFVVRPVVNQ